MNAQDMTLLFHPALAVVFVFPLIGIVVHYAWQTRQRRLQSKEGGKSKIPPVVGAEHVKLGRWLSNAVVGVALLGLAHPIFTKMTEKQAWTQDSFRAWFIVLMFVVTSASLVILNRTATRQWRAIFATLTGMGLVILGCQPEIFRRTNEWYVSHYYYGILAALLMIFSLTIIPEIYKDRTNRWRNIHIALNCFALLLFIGQGITGSRDLLEIPLSWQQMHLGKCDWANRICPP